jgi:hypothetical protein
MHELPRTALVSKDARGAERDRRSAIFRIRVPGEGIVVQDTGLIIFFPDGTVEIHGPHEQFVAGDAPICDNLS